VRAKAHKLQRTVIGLAVNQHQIGFDMAIAEFLPGTRQRMVAEPQRERRTGRKERENVD